MDFFHQTLFCLTPSVKLATGVENPVPIAQNKPHLTRNHLQEESHA